MNETVEGIIMIAGVIAIIFAFILIGYAIPDGYSYTWGDRTCTFKGKKDVFFECKTIQPDKLSSLAKRRHRHLNTYLFKLMRFRWKVDDTERSEWDSLD